MSLDKEGTCIISTKNKCFVEQMNNWNIYTIFN